MVDLAVVSLDLRKQAMLKLQDLGESEIHLGLVRSFVERLHHSVPMTLLERDRLVDALGGLHASRIDFRSYVSPRRLVAFLDVSLQNLSQDDLPDSVNVHGIDWLCEQAESCDQAESEVDVLDAEAFAIDQPKVGSASAMTHAEARVKVAEYREAAEALERQIPLDLQVGHIEDGDEDK